MVAAYMTKAREWLTVPEAAERAGLSEARIHQLRQEGKITAERAGAEDSRGIWLVYWPDIKNYLQKSS